MKLEEMSNDQLITYAKELRVEAKENREVAEVYTEALAPFDEPQRRGLVHMIKTLGEDPAQGAILFRELGDNILGDSSPDDGKLKLKDPDGEDIDMDAEEMKVAIVEAVAAALEAQTEANSTASKEAEDADFKAQVEHWDAEARKLGYEPNTPEAAELFFMANKLETTDLALADAEVKQFQEFRAARLAEADEEKPKPKPKKGGAEDEEEDPEFPKQSKGGAGAPALEGDEIDFSDDAAVRAATMRMLDSVDE
jgi:hypothetical protein